MKPAGGIQGRGFGKHASASQRRSLNSPSEGSTEVLQPCGPMPSVLSVNPVGVDCALLFTIEGEREREGKKEREGEKKRERGTKRERVKKRKKNVLKPQCLYILPIVFQEFVYPCCILLG